MMTGTKIVETSLPTSVGHRGACSLRTLDDWMRSEEKAEALRREQTGAFLKNLAFGGEAS